MKLLRVFALAVTATALSPLAWATSITGTVSVSGNDTFDSTGIVFTPTTGTLYQASGTMSSFAPTTMSNGQTANFIANLTSFTFANAAGTTIFSVTNSAGQSLSFTISRLLTETIGSVSTGPTLTLSGTGYFDETGFDQTMGTFSLTSSSAGITGFQFVSNAVTPEPTTFLLMGTGLAGIICVSLRKRAGTPI